jgi:TonB family protein
VLTALVLAAALTTTAPDASSNTSPAPAGDLLVDPVWKSRPAEGELWTFYPSLASQNGVSGFAVATCTVGEFGRLTKCKIFSEEPQHEGFGLAVTKIATSMQVEPTSSSGQKTDGREIRLGARFTAVKSMGIRKMAVELVTVQQ